MLNVRLCYKKYWKACNQEKSIAIIEQRVTTRFQDRHRVCNPCFLIVIKILHRQTTTYSCVYLNVALDLKSLSTFNPQNYVIPQTVWPDRLFQQYSWYILIEYYCQHTLNNPHKLNSVDIIFLSFSASLLAHGIVFFQLKCSFIARQSLTLTHTPYSRYYFRPSYFKWLCPSRIQSENDNICARI